MKLEGVMNAVQFVLTRVSHALVQSYVHPCRLRNQADQHTLIINCGILWHCTSVYKPLSFQYLPDVHVASVLVSSRNQTITP